MVLLPLLILLFGAATWGPASAQTGPRAVGTELDALLDRYPADSLVAPLRRFESQHGRDPIGAEAALVLGRLHYARGEYVQAAAAFSRAAARLEPARKTEARYWAGLSWLALGHADQARSALEPVAATASPRTAEARLGIALAFEMAGRPDRAYDELERLAGGDPGEAGPAALERLASLADRLQKHGDADRARARLLEQYPRSIEAARASAPSRQLPASATGGAIGVQIGVFSSKPRAEWLTRAAKSAGFGGAGVVVRGDGASRLFIVRLGTWPTADEARAAGESAVEKLGVTYQLVGAE
jgi:tetratricopeptide (TPR) repeat protein